MRQAAATTVRIRSQRMSRTIKAKRYNTFAGCIRRSGWNDIAYPLAMQAIKLARLPTCGSVDGDLTAEACISA
jgi:hypothetical protein